MFWVMYLVKKIDLMKQNHLLKKGFVIFLKGATILDFIDHRLLNYITYPPQVSKLFFN